MASAIKSKRTGATFFALKDPVVDDSLEVNLTRTVDVHRRSPLFQDRLDRRNLLPRDRVGDARRGAGMQ